MALTAPWFGGRAETGDVPVAARSRAVQPSRSAASRGVPTIDGTAAPAPPKLYRAADGRVVAGVAQGLATHLRLSARPGSASRSPC